MARKTVGYVHMEWTCPNCGTRNLGTQAVCRNCATPQPDDVQFDQAVQEELITDEALIAKAKAGPDIHCPYCGTRNPADAIQCRSCLADLREADARDSGQIVGAHQTKAVPDVQCPSCGTMNDGSATHCINCQTPLPRAARPVKPKPTPKALPARRRGKVNPLVLVILAVLVLACGVIIFLSSRTEETVGRVVDVGWERTVLIEGLGPVTYEAWVDEVPSDGVVGACRQEVRSTSSQPQPNSQEVCGTPYTVDTGTGLGEVVQDCEYLIFDDFCSYTVDEWQVVDSVSVGGRDFAPAWPVINFDIDQREGDREESYEVVFQGDGRSYTYHPDDLNEFRQFDIGSSWVLEVNAFNNVRAVSPAN